MGEWVIGAILMPELSEKVSKLKLQQHQAYQIYCGFTKQLKKDDHLL